MDAPLARLRALLPGAMVHDRLWAAARLDEAERRLASGRPAERMLAEVDARLAASLAEAARRAALPLAITYPEALPVSQRRDDILRSLADSRVLVLTGETGSGKTTQLPKMLIEAGYGRRGLIALTQPRRLAAVAMAARIAEELAAPPGVVAHSVRFDDRAGADTVIRVMTDGLLLAEAAKDRELSRYEAIIIDEAHERSLNIDLLLGLLRLLRARRPELCLAVSSASIEAERFAAYLAPAPVLAVEGRLFPVDIRWQPPADDDTGYQQAAVAAVRDIHESREAGDVLVFLPTERDIIEAQRRLDDLGGASVLPLFSRLTPGEQQRVFAPARGRKVVLATNIAETSLTIPGIRYVVDTGLARLKRYQAASRTERLPVEGISQASAKQRAGRAGRIEAGVCIRLYAEEDFAARDAYTPPEILRSNLAGVLLTCLGMDLGEAEAFPWLDAPASHAWQQARLLLEELGAVEAAPGGGLRITALGRTLAAIPADPQVARILVAGLVEGVPHEAATIAAFLSVQDARVRPLGKEAKADAAHRAFWHEAGDLASILRLWAQWEAEPSNSRRARFCEERYLGFRRMREWADVRHQLWTALREGRSARQHGDAALPSHGYEDGRWPLDAVHRAVLAGMLGNVLMWDQAQGAYRAAGDRLLAVHPGSALRAGVEEAERAGQGKAGVRKNQRAPWLVACEVVETSRLFARLCAPIDPEWVVRLAGERIRRRHRDPHWEPRRGQVVCLETVLWKGLPLRDGRLVAYEHIDARDASRIFVAQGLAADEPPVLAVVQANQRVFRTAQGLRHRLRDPALWVEREQLEAAYRVRLGLDGAGAGAGDHAAPPVIASTAQLRTWLHEHGDDALRITLADLTTPAAAAAAEQGAPERVVMGGRTLALAYRFSPGDEDDGTTLELGEDDLRAIDPSRLDWLVPGRRVETVEAYLQQLPKDERRVLIPLANTAVALAAELDAFVARRPLHNALAELLRTRHGIRAALDPTALPAHLRLRYRLVAADGSVAYAGREPAFLATQGGASADRLRLLRAEWETPPGAAWPGDCVGAVEHLGIRAWIGLGRCRDAGGRVAMRRTVYASERACTAWHADGIEAGLEAALADDLDRLVAANVPAALAARCRDHLGAPAGALRRRLALLAAGSIERRRIRDAAAWDDLVVRARAALLAAVPRIDPLLAQIGERAEALRRRLRQGAKTLGAAQATRSVAAHLDRLLVPGWDGRLPWSAQQRLPLYLDGLARRLDGQAQRGAEERIAALWSAWDDAVPAGGRLVAACGQVEAVRDLAAALEECAYALAAASGGTAAGQAEMRLRTGLDQLDRVLGDAGARLADARQRLTEARPLIHRIVVESRRTALAKELDDYLAGFPDLGLGCDIDGQVQAAGDLVKRVRGAL